MLAAVQYMARLKGFMKPRRWVSAWCTPKGSPCSLNGAPRELSIPPARTAHSSIRSKSLDGLHGFPVPKLHNPLPHTLILAHSALSGTPHISMSQFPSSGPGCCLSHQPPLLCLQQSACPCCCCPGISRMQLQLCLSRQLGLLQVLLTYLLHAS